MQWQRCGNAETVIWLVVFGEVVIKYDRAFKTRRADVTIDKKQYGQNEMLSNKGGKRLKRRLVVRAGQEHFDDEDCYDTQK